MSSSPFISNDNFIFYSDISLTQQYSKLILDSIFSQFIQYTHRRVFSNGISRDVFTVFIIS